MRTIDELEQGWISRLAPPRDGGAVRLLCVRKGGGVHETPSSVLLIAGGGLDGDRWAKRDPASDPDGATGVTLINANVAELISGDVQPLHAAGDNMVVDLDIGVDALPASSRLAIGDAILRVSEQPHTGCSTFRDKFGLDALKWVSTPDGRARRLRGVNCSVVRGGTVRVGDAIAVQPAAAASPEPEAAAPA